MNRTHFYALIMLCAHLISYTSQDSFMQLFNEGNEQYKMKRFDKAIEAYKKAIALDDTRAQIFFNLGLAYDNEKNTDKALESFAHAVKCDPTYAKAHVHLGNSLRAKQRFDEAVSHYDTALYHDPKYVDALINKGQCLNEQYKFDESIVAYRKAVELAPHNTQALLNLANALNMANYIEDSLEVYYKLLELLPNSASIQYNIAYTLKKIGKVDEAIPLYKKVLERNHDYPEAHFGLGLSYLLIGDWEKGWPEYEWRWLRSNNAAKPRVFKEPTWDGSDLHGKRILIHAEQGLGDTFQFVRYAKVAKDKGGYVIVATQRPLITLLRHCPYIDEVVQLHDNYPSFDVQAAMVSMPLICNTRKDNAPNEIPYLYAHPSLVELWRKRLASDTNFKIGICWQGNPNYNTHFLRVAVAAKSINVNQFAPLGNIPGVSVYCLQHTTGMEQLKDLDPNFNLIRFDGEDFDNSHGRFMDTAALMKNLDLIVTIDTSTAHLAAALGTPTWIMIPNPPDWRWMLDCDDTPWYPNMRLFRQPTPGDWESVLVVIERELRKKLDLPSITPLTSSQYSLAHFIDELLILEQKQPTSHEIPKKRAYLMRTHGNIIAQLTDTIDELRTCIAEMEQVQQEIICKEQAHEQDRSYHMLHITLADLKDAKQTLLSRIAQCEQKDA